MKKRNFKRIRRADHASLGELNITPLLDLVFVLLVIFIITTPQLTNSLEINLPSGKAPPPMPQTQKPKINHIVVNEKGQPFLNGVAFELPALKETLQQMKSSDPELSVILEGSKDVDYQNMINILDILQQLDITKVGLATETTQTSP